MGNNNNTLCDSKEELVAVRDLKFLDRSIIQNLKNSYGLKIKKRHGFIAINLTKSTETKIAAKRQLHFLTVESLERVRLEAQKRYDEKQKLQFLSTKRRMEKIIDEMKMKLNENRLQKAILQFREVKNLVDGEKMNLQEFKMYAKENNLPFTEDDVINFLIMS